MAKIIGIDLGTTSWLRWSALQLPSVYVTLPVRASVQRCTWACAGSKAVTTVNNNRGRKILQRIVSRTVPSSKGTDKRIINSIYRFIFAIFWCFSIKKGVLSTPLAMQLKSLTYFSAL